MMVKNIALLGHKDHGKSTLIGSLLMQTGAATQVRIKEAEAYSKKLHKAFEPAFILDSFHEEREEGRTIDTTRAEITYKDTAFALIDVPGHEELIKNMISGASYGEMAVLLVSAKGEEGIRDQTKRHLFIARMLGIDRLVVAVNKVDTIGYDRKKFEEIRDGLEAFIERIGFAKKNVHFIPISAYNGENLVKKSENIPWYKGDTLLELLYKDAAEKEKAGDEGMRTILQGALDGDMVVGRIASGSIKIGDDATILPARTSVRVKEIKVKGVDVKKAAKGENVALKLDKRVGEVRGQVLSDVEKPPRLSDRFDSRIFVTSEIGGDLAIKFNGVDIRCRGLGINNSINTCTGEKSKAGKAKVLDAIEASVSLEREIPIESYDKLRELGRFVLYSGREFAGIGIIL